MVPFHIRQLCIGVRLRGDHLADSSSPSGPPSSLHSVPFFAGGCSGGPTWIVATEKWLVSLCVVRERAITFATGQFVSFSLCARGGNPKVHRETSALSLEPHFRGGIEMSYVSQWFPFASLGFSLLPKGRRLPKGEPCVSFGKSCFSWLALQSPSPASNLPRIFPGEPMETMTEPVFHGVSHGVSHKVSCVRFPMGRPPIVFSPRWGPMPGGRHRRAGVGGALRGVVRWGWGWGVALRYGYGSN